MSDQPAQLEEIIAQVTTLSSLDKVRLVEKVMEMLERELEKDISTPKRSLYGLWSDLDISDSTIDDARQEMWDQFPREDV